MTEPTYEFVKGEGWVLGGSKKVGYIIDRSNQRWKVTEVTDPIPGYIWDATSGYGKREAFRKVCNNFQEYLDMRNYNCEPLSWSKWDNHLSRAYPIYYMYEMVNE